MCDHCSCYGIFGVCCDCGEVNPYDDDYDYFGEEDGNLSTD